MTGRNRPKELRDKISQLIRYEMQGMPTASLGRIKTLDEDNRRATIETVPDGGTETGVPVASPFATDGVGDLTPLDPERHDSPVRGIVLYLHHPLDRQLGAEGYQFDGEREHDEENAIFLPAMLWFGGEDVPEHAPDERTVSGLDGSKLSIDEESASLEHHLGAALEALGSPEPEYEGEAIITEERDPIEEWGEDPDAADNTSWPIGDEQDDTAGRLSHPDGPAVTVVDRGISLEESQHIAAGPFNSGERTPLAGRFQHFHVQNHPDGTADLIGPQLEFREFIAWMTDADRQAQLNNADEYAEAREYAESYLAWLEDELGRSVDPTDPFDWPDPEPMPTPEEHATMPPYGSEIESGVAAVVATARPVAVATYSERESDGVSHPGATVHAPSDVVFAEALVPTVVADTSV